MKTNVKWVSGKTREYEVGEGVPRWERVWLIVAAIWLQIIVVAFLVVQVSRVETPIVDWLDRLTGLLVRQ